MAQRALRDYIAAGLIGVKLRAISKFLRSTSREFMPLTSVATGKDITYVSASFAVSTPLFTASE